MTIAKTAANLHNCTYWEYVIAELLEILMMHITKTQWSDLIYRNMYGKKYKLSQITPKSCLNHTRKPHHA